MKKQQSLFREFLNASSYTDPSTMGAQTEAPIKTQLQTLLSNLPDEEQLAAFEGDLHTLKTSAEVMHWESPSMNVEINKIAKDVLTIREKLRTVISSVEQLLRDVNIANYEEEGDNLEKGTIQEEKDPLDYNPKDSLDFKWDDWEGKSKGFKVSDFPRAKVLQGARVEMEHTEHAKMAIKIACDHLAESPSYYDDLAKMEKKEKQKSKEKDNGK